MCVCCPQSTFGRHLCLHRFQLWWIKPSHGISGLDVPPETSLLLAERHPSKTCKTYVALLPLSDTRARSCLHRLGQGDADHDPSALALSADTGDAATPLPDRLGILLVATGSEPFRLVHKLAIEATRRLRGQLGYGTETPVVANNTETVPDFVDSFGWCTWDSFYTMVTPEGTNVLFRPRDGQFYKKFIRSRCVRLLRIACHTWVQLLRLMPDRLM